MAPTPPKKRNQLGGRRADTVRLVLRVTPTLRARLEREVREMGLSTTSHVAELAIADFLDRRRLARGEVFVEIPDAMRPPSRPRP